MSNADSNDQPGREDRFNEIIAAYLEEVDSGENPHREAWLAQHPEFADDLRNLFATQDQFAPLRPQRDPSRMRIRYVGDYELLEELGRGGMGVVYKATQISLNRTVAVKLILDSRLVSETDIRRFQMEAESAANLQHPAIVTVYEVGVHEGQHYFSMAYVEGKTLAALIREGPLPAEQAARYVRQIAVAVHYAHQQGTLHRDLKPSNILIDLEDQAHITDFGLAKRVSDDSNLTTAGEVLGTPSYISPEQALSQQEDIGPPADVYSLGATLYAALVGRPPFQAASVMDTLQQVIHNPPVSPRILNPAIPRDLDTICLKCLDKERGKRYATAAELGEDLHRWLNGEPIHARRIGRVARFWRTRNNTWRIVRFLLVFMLTNIALAGIYGYLAARREVTRFQHRATQEAEEMGPILEKALSRAGGAAGDRDVREMLSQMLDSSQQPFNIRWVSFDDSADPEFRPAVPGERLSAIVIQEHRAIETDEPDGASYRHVYWPVALSDEKHGTLEISFPETELTATRQEIIQRTVLLVSGMLLINGMLVVVLAIRFLGE